MKFVKPSGIPGKRHFRSYFAHVNDYQYHECAQNSGESKEHIQSKHFLRMNIESYKFKISSCPQCHESVWFSGAGHTVNLEMKSIDGKYRYDCVLMKNDTPCYILEVLHTHKTGHEKINHSRINNIPIAEFTTSDILSNPDGGILDNILKSHLFCSKCISKACYMYWEKELNDVLNMEEFIWDCWNVCFHIQKFEISIQLLSERNKAKEILAFFQSQTLLHRKGFTVIVNFDQIMGGGILFRHNNKELCFLGVLQNTKSLTDIKEMRNEIDYLKLDIHPDNIYIIHARSIINNLQTYRTGSFVEYNDCKFAFIQNQFTSEIVCSFCLKSNHSYRECWSMKVCFRCKRNSHKSDRCFAKFDVYGNKL